MTGSALTILHLSDSHLFGDGSLHYGTVDTTAALHRVLDRAASIGSLDVVVASGDLSDDGSEASYFTVKELVDPWAAQRGAVVIYAMGNHDQRAGFEAVLGPREQVTMVRGFRIVTLDSSVPGAGYGELDDAQLDWLRGVLASPAEHGTIVVLHHPPIPALSPLLATLELTKPQALQEICAAGEVRAVLCGHYHHPLASTVGGPAVLVAPGIANCAEVAAAAGHESARVGAGFALVHIPADRSTGIRFVPVTAPSPDDGTVIFDLPPEQVAQIALAAGPRAAGDQQ